MHGLLHEGRCLLDLVEADVHRARDVDEHSVRTVDGGLQQRGRNGHARGLLGLVLAGGAADAHVGKACILHNGGHVGKIEVDEARVADQVRDALHRLTQHVVRDLERVGKGDLLVGRVLEALVRDDDERVDLGLELFNARFRLRHAAAAFKTEGLRHDADGQDARLARDLGNNGRAARAGAAAHAGGDEDHIGVLERLGDLVAALLGALAADLRVGARALTVRQLFADLNFISGGRHVERLLICIHRDKVDTARTGAHHAVDHVVAAAANADDLDLNYVFRTGLQSECHVGSSCNLLYRQGTCRCKRHNIRYLLS